MPPFGRADLGVDVDVVQVWLLVGVPVLFIALALFTARSPVLGPLGVLVALGGAVVVTTGAATGDDPVRRHDADRASPT
jgi:hypothetical protein